MVHKPYMYPKSIKPDAFSQINTTEKDIFHSALKEIFLGRQNFLRAQHAQFLANLTE